MQNPFSRPDAVACIRGDRTLPKVSGTVKFYQRGNGTLVVAQICGLPRSETGFFGFHIHEGGDCCGEGFPNTGGHFDPCGTEHPQHAGDLPSLLACNGEAYLAVLTGRFRVKDVIGRTVVIHSRPDDFRSQPSGDAGEKIASGVIREF